MKNFGFFVLVLAATNALAQTTVTPVEQPAPAVTHTVVNNGPGDQTDPQISGNLVSYTSDVNGSVTIRYYDFGSGSDSGVTNSGELDFLSDVSAGRIIFTRTSADTSMYLYDTTSSAAPAEVYSEENANRHGPTIGGDVVAWQDYTFNSNVAAPEVIAYDLVAATRTRLTDDSLLDRELDLSPDGSMLVWVKCTTSGTDCKVWKAVRSGPTWVVSQVTFSTGQESRPSTDGDLIVYASQRNGGEKDIYWQNAAGVEYRLDLAGRDQNPNVRDGVIVFEHQDVGSTTFDVMAYDVATNSLHNLTESIGTSEILVDHWVDMDGLVRAAYVINDGDFDVHALSFNLSSRTPQQKLADLKDDIAAMNLHHGLANSLITKLDNVQAKLNSGDVQGACNQLNAFINEVNAQRGKKLTDGPSGQAQQLIDTANAIRLDLGCS